MVDFSILESIDFTNTDNLLFLAIFLVLFIIVLVIFIVILAKIIKIIKRALIRIFNVGVKKPKFNQKESTEWLHQLHANEEAGNMAKPEITEGTTIKNVDVSEKKVEEEKNKVESQKEKTEKDIAEELSKLKAAGSAEEGTLESKMPSTSENQPASGGDEEIKIPRQKVVDIVPVKDSNAGEKKPEEDKNTVKSQKGPGGRPTEKNIVGGSSKIKSIDYTGEGVLGRISEKTEKQEDNLKISANLDVNGPSLVYEKGKVEAGKKTPQGEDDGLIGEAVDLKTGLPASSRGSSSQQTNKDDSIFGGKSEISRSELRQKLEEDVGVFKAEKQSGLDMSPVQRAKLEKEVFSSALGGNISKTDLKLSIKKLNEKLSGAKSSAAHAKIRKEIKFFKKIGGIKG